MRIEWKELRESYPPVALAIGVLLVILMWPALSGEPRYGFVWGIGFHDGATAILLFVALILGVTAYAVEKEQDTLTPLLAKPIPANDVLATKLGIRLGLLFVAAIIVGVIELMTGAWPIEWDIPSPPMFLRWLSMVFHLVLGLGLGFYFGKRKGHQTSALLTAVMVFAAGYVLLNLTPLKFVFENEDGLTHLGWMRGILFTGLGGLVAIGLAIRSREEEIRQLSRPITIAISLAFYAALVWSVTVVPTGRIWMSSEAYFDYWNLRFGSPEKALEILVKRTRFSNDATDQEVLEWLVEKTSVQPYQRVSRYFRTYTTLIGPYEIEQIREPSANPLFHLSDMEDFTVEHRSPEWISAVLDLARSPGSNPLKRAVAIHLAGRYNHDAHTEQLAGFLQDPIDEIRFLTALALVGRGDQRGLDTLSDLAETARDFIIFEVSDLCDRYLLGQDRGIGERVRAWLEDSYQQYDLFYRGRVPTEERTRLWRQASVGLNWMDRFGSRDDLDLIRRISWARLLPSRRDTTALADVDVERWLRAWSDPEYPVLLKQELQEDIAFFDSRLDRFQELLGQWRRYRYDYRRQWDGYGAWSRMNLRVRNIVRNLEYLGAEGDGEILSIWERAKPILFTRHATSDIYGYGGALNALTHFPAFGTAGMAELESLFENPKAPPAIRIQAGLILVRQGRDEPTADVLHLMGLYDLRVFDSVVILIREGHLAFVEPVIERANEAYRNPESRRVWYGSLLYDSLGTWYWNTEIIDSLKMVSGQDFGWDLKAWTRWWEEEKVRLQAGNN